jgi:hypothetical protein
VSELKRLVLGLRPVVYGVCCTSLTPPWPGEPPEAIPRPPAPSVDPVGVVLSVRKLWTRTPMNIHPVRGTSNTICTPYAGSAMRISWVLSE